MDGAIRVLHIDDDPHFRDLTVDCLEREGEGLAVETAEAPEEAMERLDERFDCVVSDYEMPDTNGIEFLEAVRESHPDLPFILFTGQGSEAIASEAISAGVTDYLQKGGGTERFALLANRIENAVEAKRSERRLAERTRRLETLIDNLPGMVYQSRNERGWPMDSVEGEVEALVGYTPEELERGEVSWGEDVIHPADREEMWEAVQEAIDDGGSFEVTYRIQTRDGEIKWMWERGRIFETETTARLEGFITDITERREREQVLEQDEALIDAVEDGIFVANEDWEIEQANTSGAAAMGVAEEAIEGRNAVELAEAFAVTADGPEKMRSALETAFGRDVGSDPVRTEFEFSLPIGNEIVEYQFTPFEAAGDKKLAVIGRNVTARRERERELERKNERLERFASIVSHDLRNPLQIASTNLELAAADCESEYLDDAQTGLDRMGRLIDDILTLAREGERVSETEAVDLSRRCRDTWARLPTDGATLEVETDRTVWADPSRLQQLLSNLFENAVEHGSAEEADEDGTTDASEVRVRVGDLDGGFYVADNGEGIPADEREQIFEEGYTTASSGTGFGLSIVEEIAAAHDWAVSVTESASGGAQFDITGVELAET